MIIDVHKFWCLHAFSPQYCNFYHLFYETWPCSWAIQGSIAAEALRILENLPSTSLNRNPGDTQQMRQQMINLRVHGPSTEAVLLKHCTYLKNCSLQV